MKNKYLLFLLTLFIIWLCVISYYYFDLQYKKLYLPSRDYEIKIVNSSSPPLLINKKTGDTYLFSDTSGGWITIPFRPYQTAPEKER